MAKFPRFGPWGRLLRPLQWEDLTPRILSLNVSLGTVAGGTAVTITGRHFYRDSDGTLPAVAFGGVPATSVVLVNSTTITCVTPAHATEEAVDVTVTNFHGQTGTFLSGFTYFAVGITGVTPASGNHQGGDTVTVNGRHFTAGATITFGGVPATGVVFVDPQHYRCITPAGTSGSTVAVTVNTTTLIGAFRYTSVSAQQAIRRLPGVTIQKALGNSPNQARLVIDGEAVAPAQQEILQVIDDLDGNRVLFEGPVVSTDQDYESGGQTKDLNWTVTLSDYLPWLNRKRPFNSYGFNISNNGHITPVPIDSIVIDLVRRYAPWVDTTHIQLNLRKVYVTFDGTKTLSECLTFLAQLAGGGHWYLDGTELHFFRVKNPLLTAGGVTGPAMTIAPSATRRPFFSYNSGYTYAKATFVYPDGTESGFTALSNVIAIDGYGGGAGSTGGQLVDFSNIPLGGTGVAGRRVYMWFFGYWYPVVQINDNTTTSCTGLFNFVGFNTTTVFQQFFGVPPNGSFNEAAGGSDAPGATESSQTLSQIAQSVYGFSTGATVSSSFSPLSAAAFYITNVYEDDTESSPSPLSNMLSLDGRHGVDLTIPLGQAQNGLNVVHRRVYIVYSILATLTEPLSLSGSLGEMILPFALIPNNTSTLWTGFFDVSIGYVNGSIGGTIDPFFLEGPNPEDALPQPTIIDDVNPYLLRDPQVRLSEDSTQLRNRIYVIGQGTVLTTAAAVGDTVLYVSNTALISPLGGNTVLGDQGVNVQVLRVSGASGPGDITLKIPLSVPLPSGSTVRSVIQVDDTESQKRQGLIELDSASNATDGIHEYTIDDSSLVTIRQQMLRGLAELEMFGSPIRTVIYAVRGGDPEHKPGRTVEFNLSKPPIVGEFLIQSTQIDQIHDESDQIEPRYIVTASSSRFDLNDLLLMIPQTVPAVGGSPSPAGLVETAVATATAGIVAPNVLAAELVLTAGGVNGHPDIRTLNTVPQVLVSGVAGKIIVPTSWAMHDVRGGVGFNSTRNVNLFYRGNTAVFPIGTISMTAGASTNPTRRFALIQQGNTQASFDNTPEPTGQDLLIRTSGDMTGGDGATWTISVEYYLQDASPG